MLRFPGGGPGLGKEDATDKAKTAGTTGRSNRRGAAKAKAGAAASASTRVPKNPSSRPGRRIVTDTYTSQATLSDFVVAWYCLVTVTAVGFVSI